MRRNFDLSISATLPVGKAPRREHQDLFQQQTLTGWSFDIELLYIAHRRGYRVVEVPIDWYYRPESKVSAVRDALRMIGDIFRIRSNSRRGLYNAPQSRS